jgi:AbrB family looped-hinge helix DNA binding protein
MTLKVDKEGRVVLPKPLRDRLGLRAGTSLEIEERPEGVMLKTVKLRVPIVRTAPGLWVYTGAVLPHFDAVRAVEEDREDRIRKLAGL